MEFFDCNAQIGRAGAPEPGAIMTPAETCDALKACGISRALACHALSREWHPAEGNRQVLHDIAGLPLEPAWVAMPAHTGEMPRPREFVSEMRASGVGGVRIFPVLHGWRTTEWCAGELFSAFEDEGVPVFVELAQISWEEAAEILSHHPTLNLVVLRTSYRCDRVLYPLLERYPRLAIESGGYQVTGGIEALVNRFGPACLVFGAGVPFVDPGAAVAQLTYADIPEEDKAAIASGNLADLLSWR
jgi:predicted TIM-barrel fold metal-dependent hydrolase